MATVAIERQRRIFGHPAGLFVLFFTEMWERFSYYGMRTLLMLYMVQHLLTSADSGASQIVGYATIKSFVAWFVSFTGITDQLTTQILASQIYGLYTGFVYFTPFFGGLLADRYLGQRRTVYIGGILMAFGHFLMAFESQFFVALLFLILGNGCFKPNISTQVGGLYAQGDPRRDGAFTIFYMGVNLGAFLSPLICGTLGQLYGWHYGFSAAGVGMLVGLTVYHFGRHYLPTDVRAELGSQQTVDEPLTSEEWKKVFALAILCVINIVFWGVYEQQGNTLQLWADQKTDWFFFGLEIPSSWYQSVNPAFIFLFAPVLNMFWLWQNRKNSEPSTITKMALGCFLLGSAFAVMIYAARLMPGSEKGNLGWLVFATWLMTIGELYLSPIGLSLVTKMAPAKLVSMMMGVWFLSSFFGNYMSGWLGSYYEILPKETFFAMLMALGFGAGFVFLIANRVLAPVMQPRTQNG